VSTLERGLRVPPPARVPALGRVPFALLERVLEGIEEGTLVVALPDGTERRFGSGPEHRLEIRDMRFLRRIATRPKLAVGEAYQAGEWTSSDLAGVLQLLLRSSVAGGARHPFLRRLRTSGPGSTGGRGSSRRDGTSPTTTTWATTCSRRSSTRP
jgi:hypothetical protein